MPMPARKTALALLWVGLLTGWGGAHGAGHKVIASSSGGLALPRARVPNGSMSQALRPGQMVGVDLHAYASAGPRRGDIVVALGPPAEAAPTPPSPAQLQKEIAAAVAGESLPDHYCTDHAAGEGHQRMCDRAPARVLRDVRVIKRVVAVGGDRVSMRAGVVVVNGRAEKTPGIRPCGLADCSFPTPIDVPRGTVLLLGDNRAASLDSRYWGPLPVRAVIGRVVGQ
jgi:signal peptidase I